MVWIGKRAKRQNNTNTAQFDKGMSMRAVKSVDRNGQFNEERSLILVKTEGENV